MSIYQAIFFLVPFQVYCMEVPKENSNLVKPQETEEIKNTAATQTKTENESEWDLVNAQNDEAAFTNINDERDETGNDMSDKEGDSDSFGYIEHEILLSYCNDEPKRTKRMLAMCNDKQKKLAQEVLKELRKNRRQSKKSKKKIIKIYSIKRKEKNYETVSNTVLFFNNLSSSNLLYGTCGNKHI